MKPKFSGFSKILEKKQKGFIGWVVLVLFVLFFLLGSVAAIGSAWYAKTQFAGLAPGSHPVTGGGGTGGRTSYEGIDEALGHAQLSDNCAAIGSQLVAIEFMGKSYSVHQKAKTAFEAVNTDLKNAGITIDWQSGDGTFSCRPNRNDPNTMSPHAYGIAIDIRNISNPNDRRGSCKSIPNYRHDLPDAMIQIFKRHGFRWGGEFRSVCDPMHFEWLAW